MINNLAKNIKDRKSIMYKVISLGFPVYIGEEEDEFLITVLLCSKCNTIWQISRSECMFCGFENPHIYECSVCGKRYSITRTEKECCGQKLVKKCINPNCITNKDERISNFFDGLGGVFEISKSGATLNEMRCKKCGSKNNEYRSVIVKLVSNINDKMNSDNNICYLEKVSENEFNVKYKGKISSFDSIEKIIKSILNIKNINNYA